MTAVLNAIGLMSGTSMDGIEAALLRTDGMDSLEVGPHVGYPYPTDLRQRLLSLRLDSIEAGTLEEDVTNVHEEAVRHLCKARKIDLATVDLIGFHGQTIFHDPAAGLTRQLGDGQRLANALGRPVVNAFRQNDMLHGGQGAPFAPAYHWALVRSTGIVGPVAVLNIGGVSNVTLVHGDELYACDCGPGNALIDDWVRDKYQVPFDDGGRIAATGQIDACALQALLGNPYFEQRGPKSLDRNAFSVGPVSALSARDGAATLTAFTAAAIAIEATRLPRAPDQWIVVGGGRHNDRLFLSLQERLGAPVKRAEAFGWMGNAIEAQAFAYLAVRSVRNLPLSWPSTTGVREPVSGGMHWMPRQ